MNSTKLTSFKLFKNQLRRMGLFQWESKAHGKTLNIASNCIICGICTAYLITTSWFFVFIAETIAEHAHSFIFMCNAMVMILWYSICFWYKQTHIELFEVIDELFERSKSKFSFYLTSNVPQISPEFYLSWGPIESLPQKMGKVLVAAELQYKYHLRWLVFSKVHMKKWSIYDVSFKFIDFFLRNVSYNAQ